MLVPRFLGRYYIDIIYIYTIIYTHTSLLYIVIASQENSQVMIVISSPLDPTWQPEATLVWREVCNSLNRPISIRRTSMGPMGQRYGSKMGQVQWDGHHHSKKGLIYRPHWKSWLVRGIIPFYGLNGQIFRLVKYYGLYPDICQYIPMMCGHPMMILCRGSWCIYGNSFGVLPGLSFGWAPDERCFHDRFSKHLKECYPNHYKQISDIFWSHHSHHFLGDSIRDSSSFQNSSIPGAPVTWCPILAQVDSIKRYGGSTAATMPWPEAAEGAAWKIRCSGSVRYKRPGQREPKNELERSTMLLMGKSTISTGPFSIAMFVYQRVCLFLFQVIFLAFFRIDVTFQLWCLLSLSCPWTTIASSDL